MAVNRLCIGGFESGGWEGAAGLPGEVESDGGGADPAVAVSSIWAGRGPAVAREVPGGSLVHGHGVLQWEQREGER